MPRKHKVSALSQAERDIREIVLFHMENVGAASGRKIYGLIRNSLAQLGDYPYLGPIHPDPELARQGYRKLVLNRTYVTVYKVVDGTVLVYRVVNGAMDYPKLLK